MISKRSRSAAVLGCGSFHLGQTRHRHRYVVVLDCHSVERWGLSEFYRHGVEQDLCLRPGRKSLWALAPEVKQTEDEADSPAATGALTS